MVFFEAFMTSADCNEGFPTAAAPAIAGGWLYPHFQTRADHQQAGAIWSPLTPQWGCHARAGDECSPRGVVFLKHRGVCCLQSSAGLPTPACSPGAGTAWIFSCCRTQPPRFALVSAPPWTADMQSSSGPAGEPARTQGWWISMLVDLVFPISCHTIG